MFQYPGVAKSMNSDIDNLMTVLKVWDILPKGKFLISFEMLKKSSKKPMKRSLGVPQSSFSLADVWFTSLAVLSVGAK